MGGEELRLPLTHVGVQVCALVASLFYIKSYHPYILRQLEPVIEKVFSPRIYFLARPPTTQGW